MHFRAWLIDSLLSERRKYVPPEVMQQWERGFRQGLERPIRHTSDPALRSKLEAMRSCPIRDNRGHCRSFTDNVVGTMLKHGGHRKAYIEDALAYACETKMSPVKRSGDQKTTGFDLDWSRPYGPRENPLEARFKTSVGNAVRNTASGKIRRLLNTEQRPRSAISLLPGRSRKQTPGAMAADAIASPNDRSAIEMVADMEDLLGKQERLAGLPLLAIFRSMVAGETD